SRCATQMGARWRPIPISACEDTWPAEFGRIRLHPFASGRQRLDGRDATRGFAHRRKTAAQSGVRRRRTNLPVAGPLFGRRTVAGRDGQPRGDFLSLRFPETRALPFVDAGEDQGRDFDGGVRGGSWRIKAPEKSEIRGLKSEGNSKFEKR